jgi:hypothetical protein
MPAQALSQSVQTPLTARSEVHGAVHTPVGQQGSPALPDRVTAESVAPLAFTGNYRAFLPIGYYQPVCPAVSNHAYDTMPFQGSPYKDNRLTDENADFRLSILGYAPFIDQFGLGYAFYGGGGGSGDGPRLHGLFEPNRKPTSFVRTYQVYHWNWNESLPPPYGSRGSLNSTEPWKIMVVDVGATKGEAINIPERNAVIDGAGHQAMVLYAGPRELTLAYFAYDNVLTPDLHGYVVHILNFCVDPNLVSVYRSQLSAEGRRSTMRLPVVRNNQLIGTALGGTVTVAVRDGARFMDPRVLSDWWYGLP